jgi:WD40 repeat protein
VLGVAFSQDGTVLATGSDDETIQLWDVASGSPRWALRAEGRPILGVAFSPDGSQLAIASDDHAVLVLEVATRKASEDQTVRIWEVDTGITRAILEGHTSRVWRVAFRPDGNLLATAADDQTVLITWAIPWKSQSRPRRPGTGCSARLGADPDLFLAAALRSPRILDRIH